MEPPELRSGRLVLRRYAPCDREAFIELNTSALVRRYMDGPLSRSEAKQRFARFLSNADTRLEAWAVTSTATARYVGHAYLVAIESGEAAEVGFMLHPAAWRQGYGTELAALVIEHGLASGKYDRIVATVDADHVASIKVLQRAGLHREREVEDENGSYLVYSRCVKPPYSPPRR